MTESGTRLDFRNCDCMDLMREFPAVRIMTIHRATATRDGERVHPTQKPIALYHWILSHYAEPGQRILDTHLGSGSHAIAAHYFGAHLTASEIDGDYFREASARIKRETAQELLPMTGEQPAHKQPDFFAA